MLLCGWLDPVRLRLSRRRKQPRLDRHRLQNEGMRPCAKAAAKVSVRHGTFEARVDRVRGGRRNMDRLEVGDVSLEPRQAVSFDERVRDVPRAVFW